MKTPIAVALSLLAMATPARADLNATYRGVDRFLGADTPAMVQVSISKDRIAFVIHGSREIRILYSKDRATLRFVDDTEKTYTDLERCMDAGGGLISTIEGQLSQLAPDQRKMAEQMIKDSMGSDSEGKSEFVWTKDNQKVLEHDCTMVKVQREDETFAEYCACASPDFKLTGAEQATLSEANRCIGNLSIATKPAPGDPSAILEWDLTRDGFPLLIRRLDEDTVTFEVRIESFDRKAISDQLFAVPKGYAKAALGAAEADSTGD